MTMHIDRATVFNCIVAVTFIALSLVSICRNNAVSDANTVMWQFFIDKLLKFVSASNSELWKYQYSFSTVLVHMYLAAIYVAILQV